MYYLFFQIWLWLLIAFALGCFVTWFFCCRSKQHERSISEMSSTNSFSIKTGHHSVSVDTVSDAAAASIASASMAKAHFDTPVAPSDDWKPLGFTEAPDNIDDLKRIKGIGAVIEATLHEFGVYQFTQIAQWSKENIAWVENSLSFPGRIQREEWITQAKTLATGGVTEFSNRVDQGDIEY